LNGSGARFAFFDDPAGTNELFTIKGTGNVGIGTGNAVGQRLDIVGGNGRVQSGYSWLTNSDRRHKKNITTLEDVLKKVSRLRAVRYDIKDDTETSKGHGKHIGTIAQELEKEFPELVVTDEKTNYKSVAYDKLSVIAIEAAKALKGENDRLVKRLRALEARVQALDGNKSQAHR